jgi:hypothetical protein
VEQQLRLIFRSFAAAVSSAQHQISGSNKASFRQDAQN